MGAEFFYVYDGDGNIVRYIDISGKKEYNHEYEEGRIVRTTEDDIGLSDEIVTSTVKQSGRIFSPDLMARPLNPTLRATLLSASVTL